MPEVGAGVFIRGMVHCAVRGERRADLEIERASSVMKALDLFTLASMIGRSVFELTVATWNEQA